ncbi:MAG: WD40 repeat domain-containing protein [Chloroflexi bacterium]|nr:WD40 repeat domain-containing protein [Chloroflexota bacterium]MCC6891469.1 WD40 repeat domain-containing protein [Anaerolineae bacterium]
MSIGILKFKLALTAFILMLLLNTSLVSAQPDTICTGICDLASSPTVENLFGAVNEFGLWLINTNESEAQFFSHENAINLSFDPSGKYVAVISCPNLAIRTSPCKGSLSLFDLQEQTWRELGSYDSAIENVKFSPDGKYVAFQNGFGKSGVQLIDLTTGDTFTVGDQRLTNMIIEYTFNPQSTLIAISNGDIGYGGHVFWGLSIWKISDQSFQVKTRGSLLAADLTFTETENNIAFVKYNAELYSWNYYKGIVSSVDDIVGDNLNRIRFSYPPTYLLATLSDGRLPMDRMLYVWDVQSGEQIFVLDRTDDSFTNLISINSTGEFIAYGSTVTEGKIVEVWERATGTTSQYTLSQ